MSSPTIRRAFIILVSIVVIWLVALPMMRASQTTDQPVIARVTIRNQEELYRFVSLGLDLLETREGDDLFILTDPEQIERLKNDGWVIKSEREPGMTAQLRSEAAREELFNDGYRTVVEMRSQLEAIAAANPNLAEFFTYGQSWEKVSSSGQQGSDLFGIRLTNRLKPGPKPTFFLMAAIHARELSTSEAAMRFVDHLINNYGADGDVTWLLDEHLIVVVPVVNPDGRVIAERGYLQRKNTNNTYGGGCLDPPSANNQIGVDLNRNYNFLWGLVNGPTEWLCGQTYPGPSAASEPETTAIQDLIRGLFADQRGPNPTDAAPLDAAGVMITLHSYGELVLWPWGTTSGKAPNAAELEMIGRKFVSFNGYTAQQAINLYPTSGTTDDWSYGELGIASFTFEVGPAGGVCGGFFAPYRCLDQETSGRFWPRNLPALLHAARIARAPYHLARGPAPESVITTPLGDGRVELKAKFDETQAGNQSISAAEYFIDAPPWRDGVGNQMLPADGGFNSPIETATAIVNALPDRALIYVRARDIDGNWGPVRATFVGRSILGLEPRDPIIRLNPRR